MTVCSSGRERCFTYVRLGRRPGALHVHNHGVRQKDGNCAVTMIMSARFGTIKVERVWLVYYANRTPSHVIGKVPFVLGRATSQSVDDLLATLGTSDTKKIIRQRDG